MITLFEIKYLKFIFLLALILVLSAFLSACGGGSSGVKPNEQGVSTGFSVYDGETASFEITNNAYQAGAGIWIENGFTGQGVTVAVLDSGFQPGYEDKMNTVLEVNAITTTDENGNVIKSDDDYLYSSNLHGDIVAQIIGSVNYGLAPNVELQNIVVSSEALTVKYADIQYGIMFAEQNNADILNISISPSFADFRIADETFRDSLEDGSFTKSLEESLDRLDEKNSIVIKAAGNNQNNVSEQVTSFDSTATYQGWVQTSLKDNVVYVGASYGQGEELASWSGYAGYNLDVQDRFLISAAVSTADGVFEEGTSGAAATVSGGLALMLERWNHLTPAQAAQIALDTANKNFTSYNPAVHGQGHFDLVSAWSPQGKTTIPFEDGQVLSTMASYVTLPLGFKETALKTAVVDSYQRDYMVSVPVKAQLSSLKSRLAPMGAINSFSQPVFRTVSEGLISSFGVISVNNVNRTDNGLIFLGLGNEFDLELTYANSGKISLDQHFGDLKLGLTMATPSPFSDHKGVMTTASAKGVMVGAYANSRKNDSVFYGADQQVSSGAIIEYQNNGFIAGLETSFKSHVGRYLVSNYNINTNKAFMGTSREVAAGVKLGIIGYVEEATANININAPVSNGDGTLSFVKQTLNSERANTGISLSASMNGAQASVTKDDIDNIVYLGYKKQF